MRVRPAAVLLSLVATFLVGWLSTRMWGAHLHWVWRLSCVLGAWAPLGAAATLLYVREVGEREDSVYVAWLVRAIGMHWILAWMLGSSDWLRGPPGTVAQWNADLGAPVVLLGFAPVFFVSWRVLLWLRTLAPRLAGQRFAPVSPTTKRSGPMPFRGVRMVPAGPLVSSFPRATWALSAAAVALACALPAAWGGVLTVAAALCLAPRVVANARGLAPSVLSVALLGALTAARSEALRAGGPVTVAMALPWCMLGALALLLAATEARWRWHKRPRAVVRRA